LWRQKIQRVVAAGSQLPDVIVALVAAYLPADGFDWSQAFNIDPGSTSSGQGGLREVKDFIAEQFMAEIANRGRNPVRHFFLDLSTEKMPALKASTKQGAASPSQQAFEEFERTLVRDLTICPGRGLPLS
jgi:hypothetical protein